MQRHLINNPTGEKVELEIKQLIFKKWRKNSKVTKRFQYLFKYYQNWQISEKFYQKQKIQGAKVKYSIGIAISKTEKSQEAEVLDKDKPKSTKRRGNIKIVYLNISMCCNKS